MGAHAGSRWTALLDGPTTTVHGDRVAHLVLAVRR
jgi:hypothetical protein